MPYFSLQLKKSLDRILEYPLTLIETDSGCGKTTAINGYFLPIVAKEYQQYRYTSLGTSAEKSWKEFCRLLRYVDPQAAHYLEAMGVPDGDTMSEMAYQINNLVCDKPSVLCLDNFQLMDFPEKKRLIQVLSLHRCQNLHFVILTQPLKEPEQRPSFFSPGVFRIGADALMFSREDIGAYFQAEGIKLARNHLDQVWQMTEGLAAAVSLQLESWKYNGRSEPSEKISDLMETALWNHLNAHEQDCLVKLSVLDAFTLRQALLIDRGRMSPAQIGGLLRKTHFIRFDGTRRLFHFHFLLQTFLTDKFHLLSNDEQSGILRLVAWACAEERDYIRSAIFYGRLKDYENLLSLPCSFRDWIELVSLEKGKILKELISAEHSDKLLRYPELAVLFSFELYIRGNFILHKQYMEAVGRMLDMESSYAASTYRYLQGEYALIQSFLVFNDVEKMHAYHQKAASLLQGPTRLFTRHGCWTFGSPSVVSLYWREPGKLRDALQSVQTGMPVYYNLTNGNGRGGPEAMEAEVLLLQGEEKKSFELFCQAVYESERFEQGCVSYCARFGMARLALLQGNCGSFMHMKEKINDMAYKGTEPSRVFITALCEAYFHMFLGEYDEIPEWLCLEDALRRRTYVFSLPFAHVLNGRLMLEKHLKGKVSYEAFEEQMALYIQECEKLHMLLPKVYYKIYLAICRESAGRVKEAVDTFREMLSLVSADNVWLPAAELYEQLQPIMDKLAARREVSAELEQIEKLGKKYRKGIEKIQRQLCPHDAFLTPREREVAALLKQRYSVKEIAERLVISSSTVSNTMQKIYSKLGIHSKKELYVRVDI